MNEYEITRIPPQALDAEMAVIGGAMLDKMATAKVVELCQETDFYKDAHRTIYRHAKELFEKGDPVDILTVNNELEKNNLLETVGGQYYLTELVERVPSTANIEYYCKIVIDKATLRKLLKIANNLNEVCYSNSEDSHEIILRAESELIKLTTRNERGTTQFIKSGIDEVANTIDWYQEHPGQIRGLKTGLTYLDWEINGLEPDRNIVIGARPGMGKTAFALTIATHWGKQDIPGAFFSAEMSIQQLTMRGIISESGIPLKHIRKGLSEQEVKYITNAQNKLYNIPLIIDDTAGIRIEEIYAKALRMKMQYDIKYLIVDNMHIIGTNEKKFQRREQLSFISQNCKAIAKELQIPVIPLAHLNRDCEKRNGMAKMPMLADLREDGSIEQDADVVLFLFRPEYYNIKSYIDSNNQTVYTDNLLLIKIAKSRDGKQGDGMVIKARFEPEKMLISEFETKHKAVGELF